MIGRQEFLQQDLIPLLSSLYQHLAKAQRSTTRPPFGLLKTPLQLNDDRLNGYLSSRRPKRLSVDHIKARVSNEANGMGSRETTLIYFISLLYYQGLHVSE